MATLIIGGILFGLILGLFFKWPVLIPSSGVAIALVLANPALSGQGLQSLLLLCAAMITSLQFGYVFGIVVRAIHYAMKGSKRRAWHPPQRALRPKSMFRKS